MKVTHWAITGLPRRRWWHRLMFWRRGRVWIELATPRDLADTNTPRTLRPGELVDIEEAEDTALLRSVRERELGEQAEAEGRIWTPEP